jgi:hypothetical protein
MSHISEILFVDPSVACVDTILSGLRPGVAAVLLDPAQPAAWQIASALKGRHGLDAVHVIAHGAPGRVCFTSGDWSPATLEEQGDDLAAIGQALTEDGRLRLWSCDAGAGAAGTAFIEALARATGANVAAATGRIGAAACGGNWKLTAPSARPPLTAAGIADYPGVLATNTWIGGGLPNGTDWNQANNWSLGSVPTSTDDVVIDSVPNQPTIPNSVSINSLTLNVDITFGPFGGGLNVLGSIVNNGGNVRPLGRQYKCSWVDSKQRFALFL